METRFVRRVNIQSAGLLNPVKFLGAVNAANNFLSHLTPFFANRKLPIRDYLLAITIFVNAHKGIPVLQLSRDLDVQYKTAFVMAHKIRESLGRDIQKRALKGKAEVDGAYFGGYIKPANNKVARTKKLNIENKGVQHVRSDHRTCIPKWHY